MFNDMIGLIEFDVTRLMMKARIIRTSTYGASYQHNSDTQYFSKIRLTRAILDLTKVKRNDLCPCGFGKKFKNCHDATDK